ncbi:hypothetical protein HJG60_008107 [Phyllostomus discolor]|uniref:Uncharacterized protein n=1 Tax=Phyllostomus discolor TaxID=89673 RepID=A0A834BDT8_9CHIR|nr:hypothetical protein HJG60_008107 [Phyllostomus discolor]
MGPWVADNIVKILIFPNLIHKFNANHIKTQLVSLRKLLILKFVWKFKEPKIAKKILRNKVAGLLFPGVRNYYKATEIKTAWCWYKKRRMSAPKSEHSVHSSNIHDGPKVGTAHTPTDEWIKKVWHTHELKYYLAKKKGSTNTHYNMDEP